MKRDRAAIRYTILFISMLMIFLKFGCATVKQGYKDVSQKAKGVFAEEKEQKPVVTEASEDLGVVCKIKQYLPVKLAPSPGAKDVGKLYLDDTVTIDSEEGRWFYIRRKDEAGTTVLEGWVVKDYIKRLPTMGAGVSESQGFVVNINNYLPVKSAPSVESKTIGRLYLGDKVRMEEEQEQWCHIARMDPARTMKLEGWVKGKYVEELSSDEQAAESLIDLTYIRGGGSSVSPTQDDKHKDMKTRTKVEGTVAGAATGAALGALAGKATSDEPVKGAVVGAVVGAAVGYAAGSYIAGQKEKYANDEEYLNAAIEEASRYNREAEARNDTLQEVIAAAEQEIKVLKYKIGEISLKQQRAEANISVLNRISQETEQRIAELQGLVDAQEDAISNISKDTPHLKELHNEMQITRDQIRDLKEKRNQLETLMGEMAEQTV
jgi:hypothetical protein